MLNWPSHNLNTSVPLANQLPDPTTDFGDEIDNSTVRTKMDSGYTLQRGRFTTGMRSINCSWDLDSQQKAVFEGLVHYYLNDGAAWFNMSLDLGHGFQTYVVRFVGGKFKANYVPVNRYKVTAKLECENISVLSKAQLDAIIPP